MQKGLIALIMAVLLSSANAVGAASVNLDGDIRIRIQTRTGDVAKMKDTFTITRVRLNAALPVDERVSIYSRLAVEQAAGSDHNNGLYDTAGVLDRWGINWKYDKGVVTIGRQDVVLGQDGLVLTTLIDAVGRDNQLTGISTYWRNGNTSVKMIGGRLGEGLFQPIPNMAVNLYAVQLEQKINRGFNIGATYRQVAAIDQYSSRIASRLPPYQAVLHTYSLFGSYYLDNKTMVYTEVGKSNADRYSQGLGVGIAHKLDNKSSCSINFFRQGVNSGMFRNWGAPELVRDKSKSNIWNGYAAYYRYQMDKKTSLELSDYYEYGGNNDANQLRISLMASF